MDVKIELKMNFINHELQFFNLDDEDSKITIFKNLSK